MSKSILTWLSSEFTEPIRDPVWKNITFTKAMMKIIGSGPFQQLCDIRQLGPTYMVYPGATHTRFNHSLGVFHIAKQIIRQMLLNPDLDFLSQEGVKAFLCAALLHDLGHYPYAHSLKELPLKDHEQLTAEAILDSELRCIIAEEVGTDPMLVAAIVDQDLDVEMGPELAFYRNILSGVLDPDKLDYLTRDAFFCGIPYGVQDTDFIISKIHPHTLSGIALDLQGLSAVENLLFSKYMMYRNVYWHRTVRIATAMIKKAILQALRDEAIQAETLYGLSDNAFIHTAQQISYPLFTLIDRVCRRKLHKAVFQVAFDDKNPRHHRLLNLEQRTERENQLIAEASRECGSLLSAGDLIIDIPEPISFEIDIPILDNGIEREYTQSGSVFSGPVIAGFTRSLRNIQIFVAPEYAELLNGRRWEI